MRDAIFSKAEIQHAESLVALINSAYRGDASRVGWTTEADLLDGRRTDREQILQLLADADSMILLCRRGDELLGCVHLHNGGDAVHLGMLAVSPPLQSLGIGKRLLRAAESEAAAAWGSRRFAMSVISLRSELIAFYQRQGYRRTGISEAFPVNPALWTPKVEGLCLELLEKCL